MIGKDGLWKGIIEDLADDLLRFFFPEQVGLIDWERGIEFLDKELQQLFPESDGHDRHADKLFKVWLKSGEEQWFLVHVEVQGYPDPDFARRMYEYFYRIEARYGRPVTALAIYTDTDRRCHFKEYHYSFWGTELHYQFNTFVLMDHPSEELAEMDNIFAIVMEAAWQGLNDGKWDQKALLNAKLNLARKLYKKGYKKKKIQRVYSFIRFYIDFEEKEFSVIFESSLSVITKSRAPMGIIEYIQEELKKEAWESGLKEGREKGLEEGRVKGREEGREEALKISIGGLLRNGFTVEQIADFLSLPLEEALQIVEALQKESAPDEGLDP